MATTTNYGWTTPDDTALVKDGASAIRSLGTAVDTTTKNLNPSTTLGDIEYRSSTANTNTRLAIGTTGQVLTVAGGVPTWASASAGFVGCSLYNNSSAAVSIANNTETVITWDSENFDTDAFHSTSTNTSRITIPAGKAGKYSFNASFWFEGSSAGNRWLKILKNGSAIRYAPTTASSTGNAYSGLQATCTLNLAEGDYIEVLGAQNSGSALGLYRGIDTGLQYGWFECTYLGA